MANAFRNEICETNGWRMFKAEEMIGLMIVIGSIPVNLL